jgi:hypothetical protein
VQLLYWHNIEIGAGDKQWRRHFATRHAGRPITGKNAIKYAVNVFWECKRGDMEAYRRLTRRPALLMSKLAAEVEAEAERKAPSSTTTNRSTALAAGVPVAQVQAMTHHKL